MSIELFRYLSYIILQPLYIFTIYKIYQNWFGRNPKKNFLIVFSLFFIADTCIYIFLDIPYIMLTSSFALLFFCTIPFNDISKNNIIISLITLLSFTLSEFISYGIFKLLGLILDYNDESADIICTLVITRLVQLLITPNVPKLFKNRFDYINTPKYTPIIYAIPVSSIWIMFFCYSIASPFNERTPSDIVCLLITLLLIVFMNIISFIVFDKQAKHYNTIQENLSLKNIINMQIKEYNENKIYAENIMQIKHDMKNNYISLLSHAKSGNTERIIELISDKLLHIESNENISNSGYFTLDSIINYKYNIAQKNNIEFAITFKLEQKPKVEESDICVLVGNALDNAIEYLTEHQIPNKTISICVHSNAAAFVLTIKNEVETDVTIDYNSSIPSTKSEPYHGYGLLSARNIAWKYNGNIIVTCKNNIFSFGAVLFYKT